MKLYSSEPSPFAARIWIACAIKGLAVEELAPPGGPTSPGFLAINPVGKILVLIDGDETIIESETILDYLDDRYPDPPLRPAPAAERARMRTLIRINETYVVTPVSRLFSQLDPRSRTDQVVADEVARWRESIGWLASFMVDAPFAVGDRLSLADCVLPPSLLLGRVIAEILGIADPAAMHPALAGYTAKVRDHGAVGAALARAEAGIAAMRRG